MQELIDPDFLDHFPPRLEGIDEYVTQAQHGEPLEGYGCCHGRHKEHESHRCGVHQAVVDEYLPVLSLFRDHPDALEREVSDEMQGRIDDQSGDGVENHDHSFSERLTPVLLSTEICRCL